MKRCITAFLLFLSAALVLAGEALSVPTLTKTIPLPGVEGRFDHAAYDANTHRLFFAALGNNTLEAVNVETGQRVHTITGLKKPTGVLFLPEPNVLVVANGDDGTCRFYDGSSYQEKGRLTGVDDADNLRFDAKAKLIYLGYGEGALGTIDPLTMKLKGSIALAKHPESFQLETSGPRIFVNVPDAKQIAVVDRAAGRVSAAWPLEDVKANFPMALDDAQHRIFIGCRQPARLLVFDTTTAKRIAESPMSGDVDDLFFHAATRQILASCGEGFVDVFDASSPDILKRTTRVPTAEGARTCFFDPSGEWLCVAVPHRGAQRAELRFFRTGKK